MRPRIAGTLEVSRSEALAHEWRPHGVDVLALCPGATESEFAQVAGISHTGMSAKAVVGEALAALGRRDVLVTGRRNRLSAFLTRLAPRWCRTAIGARVVASFQTERKQLRPRPGTVNRRQSAD
jgi:short-subunit dehydrogenase